MILLASCYLGLGDSWTCFIGFWIAIAYQAVEQIVELLFVLLPVAFVIVWIWVNADDGALHRKLRNMFGWGDER